MQQRDDERLITSASNAPAHHTSSSIQHDEEMCTLFFFLGFLMNIVWIVNFVKVSEWSIVHILNCSINDQLMIT